MLRSVGGAKIIPLTVIKEEEEHKASGNTCHSYGTDGQPQVVSSALCVQEALWISEYDPQI